MIFVKTKKRVGITVGQYEREWVGTLAALVNEVDAETVHVAFEMCEPVQRPFLLPPVVAILPMINQLLEVGDIGARIPGGAFNLVRPAGFPQALL
jgi:hypothetical protein